MNQSPPPNRYVQLFESRYDIVLATAWRYAPDPSLVYDIVHQAFLLFVQKAEGGDWDLDNKLDPLLHGIVKNVALKVWEQERKNTPQALRVIGERFLTEFRDHPEETERKEGQLAALGDCMQRLTEKSRRILDRHYREGVSMEEIGRQSGVKPNTIRQTISRLRAKLRDCIEERTKSE